MFLVCLRQLFLDILIGKPTHFFSFCELLFGHTFGFLYLWQQLIFLEKSKLNGKSIFIHPYIFEKLKPICFLTKRDQKSQLH
jgi:hypothetical protein